MISIIVPVYNAERHLRKCIDSILNQTYKDLEIILVDDASKDGSLDICRQYQKQYPNVHVHQMEKNSGQVSAYTKGIQEAAGEWIGFVDSDDWIEPDMYAELVESHRKYRTDIACCGIYMDFPWGSKIEPDGIERYKNLIMTHAEIVKEFFELHVPGNKINDVYKLYRYTKIYRRCVVEQNLKYLQKEIRVFEDNNFVIPCLLDASSISYVGKPLYHYVRRSDSTMGVFKEETLASNEKFLDNLRRIYQEKGIPHIFDSDAFVTTAFSINGILLSDASWKKKILQLQRLSKSIRQYDLSFKKCCTFGASYKVAWIIQMLRKEYYSAIRFFGWAYKTTKGIKKHGHFK